MGSCTSSPNAIADYALARDADNLVATMTEHIRLTTELIIAAN